MIICHLNRLMEEKGISQNQLWLQTEIRPATIAALRSGAFERLEKRYLDALCRVLGCKPGDLFDYVPDVDER